MTDRTLAASLEAHLRADRHVADSAVEVAGGTMLRSRRFPHAWDLNQLVLAPGAGPAEVAAGIDLVERELAGEAHRRLTVPDPAAPVAPPDGWRAEELLVMVLAGGRTPPWPPQVQRVPRESLRASREEMWRAEGSVDAAVELAAMQAEFGSFPGAQTLAALEAGQPVAWAQVVNGVVDDVFVRPEHRGRGLGRAVTSAAVAAGGWSLWVDASDPRPQGLYRSLGFRECGRVVHMTRRVG